MKRMKTIEPIIEMCVRSLAELKPIKYIMVTPDKILASNKIVGRKVKIPVTKPYTTAIGISLFFDFRFKMLEFYEINSAEKGWGQKMVQSVLECLPVGWMPTIVFSIWEI